MSTEVTTLANGLRIVSHRMSHLETTSLGVWVGVGARHESPREHGISHLLEHMAFKGTSSRTARTIAEEIEEVGGDLNAATSLDTTAYYSRVLKGDEQVALGLIADILQNSAVAEDELDREREVILQEIAGTQDSPEDIAYELLQETAFPQQSVGRPILGTPKSVSAISAADIKAFLATHYHPSKMVVAAAGAVSHKPFVRHVEALFGRLTAKGDVPEQPARYVGGVASDDKRFEQTHLLVGFRSPSYRDKNYYTAQVFSGLFGGGMSSRLFQEARERRGLCYSIYSSAWGLKDVGMLTIHAAVRAETLEKLVHVVRDEIATLAKTGPDDREIERSKAQLKAGLLMGLESSGVRAEQLARQLLSHDRLITTEELVAGVDAVTPKHLKRYAASLYAAPPTVTVIGSGKRSKEQAKSAAAVLAKLN